MDKLTLQQHESSLGRTASQKIKTSSGSLKQSEPIFPPMVYTLPNGINFSLKQFNLCLRACKAL